MKTDTWAMKPTTNSGHAPDFRYFRFYRGFTLVELLMAVLIFAMMMSALATIYGTITRHMFHNYRQNILKSNLAIAMKVLESRLVIATRIDSPAFSKSDNVLAFTTNVDSQTGCSPMNFLVPNRWHYFCRAYNGSTKLYDLYYHTGKITGSNDTGGCPASVDHSNEWIGTVGMGGHGYPILACGAGGVGTVTKILENAQIPLSGFMFSRADAQGIKEVDQVRAVVRTKKTLNDGRNIDITLDTVIHTQTTPQ